MRLGIEIKLAVNELISLSFEVLRVGFEVLKVGFEVNQNEYSIIKEQVSQPI